MKKVIIFFLVFTIGLILTKQTINAQVILQQPLADQNDSFFVTRPAPNTILNGNKTISWIMFDNNQAQIPFSVSLFDSTTCQNNNFGQIGSVNIGPSSTNEFSIAWNTATFQASAGLSDGNYCLRVCVTMKNNSLDYSACNGRIVRLVNNNSLPIITSIPSNLVINETQNWSYQITANDVDNDTIVYRLVQGPNFLNINQSTGLLSTNSNPRFLPNGIYRADYTIVVSADDGISGSVSQQFVLSITKPIPQQSQTPNTQTPNNSTQPSTIPNTPQPPSQSPSQPSSQQPSQAPSQQPSPPPTSIQTNSPTRLSFNNIEQLSLIDSDEVEILFSVSDADGIDKIEVFYIKENTNEKRLIESFSEDNISSKLVWNLTNIENGKYYLRIEVTDKAGIVNQKESTTIEVKRTSNEEEINEPPVTEEVKIALIVNAIPLNQAEIVDRRPVISGEFRPSSGAIVNTESFDVRIDGKSILSECQVDTSGFVCNPVETLPLGERTIFATFTDTEGAVAELEWKITVKTLEQIIQDNNNSINIFGVSVLPSALIAVLVIICLTLLLLLIPWILFSRFKSGQTKEKVLIQESTPMVDEYDDFLNSVNSQNTTYSEVPPIITAEVVRNEPTTDNNVDSNLTEKISNESQLEKETDPIDEYLNYISADQDLKKNIEQDIRSNETYKSDNEVYVEPKPTD